TAKSRGLETEHLRKRLTRHGQGLEQRTRTVREPEHAFPQNVHEGRRGRGAIIQPRRARKLLHEQRVSVAAMRDNAGRLRRLVAAPEQGTSESLGIFPRERR